MEITFDSDGFLTDRFSDIEGAVDAVHHPLFTRALQINRDAHDLFFAADIRSRDGVAIITATLFMRALEHYQATVLLLRRAMVAPAQVTLRALVEAVFRLRAIVTEPTAFKTFITEDLVQQKKLVKSALTNPHHPNLEETAKIVTPEFLAEIEKDIKTVGAKHVTTAEWSKLAGMHDWYTTNYALLSNIVHTAVRDLDVYLKLDGVGEVRELVYAPSLKEIPQLLLTAAHLILIAASAFDKTFGINFGPKGDAHSKWVEEGFRALNEGQAPPAECSPHD